MIMDMISNRKLYTFFIFELSYIELLIEIFLHAVSLDL